MSNFEKDFSALHEKLERYIQSDTCERKYSGIELLTISCATFDEFGLGTFIVVKADMKNNPPREFMFTLHDNYDGQGDYLVIKDITDKEKNADQNVYKYLDIWKKKKEIRSDPDIVDIFTIALSLILNDEGSFQQLFDRFEEVAIDENRTKESLIRLLSRITKNFAPYV